MDSNKPRNSIKTGLELLVLSIIFRLGFHLYWMSHMEIEDFTSPFSGLTPLWVELLLLPVTIISLILIMQGYQDVLIKIDENASNHQRLVSTLKKRIKSKSEITHSEPSNYQQTYSSQPEYSVQSQTQPVTTQTGYEAPAQDPANWDAIFNK